jgi:hypothetical protein
MRTILPLLLSGLLALSSCGGGTSSDPLVGTYVLDVDKTLARRGAAKPDEAALRSMRADFAPDAYRFDLREDEFALRVGSGAGSLVVEGSWDREAGGLRLVNETANGVDIPDDQGGGQVSTARVEDGWIVLVTDEGEVWLRRA